MPSYGIPELSTEGNAVDFSQDFEDMLIDYIYDDWSIADPAKPATKTGINNTIEFRPGFPANNKPYEVSTLTFETLELEKLSSVQWYMQTNVTVRLREMHIAQSQKDPQLGNMEREILRMVHQYRDNEILGIKRMMFLGGTRIYERDDSITKSEWESTMNVGMTYSKINIEVF